MNRLPAGERAAEATRIGIPPWLALAFIFMCTLLPNQWRQLRHKIPQYFSQIEMLAVNRDYERIPNLQTAEMKKLLGSAVPSEVYTLEAYRRFLKAGQRYRQTLEGARHIEDNVMKAMRPMLGASQATLQVTLEMLSPEEWNELLRVRGLESLSRLPRDQVSPGLALCDDTAFAQWLKTLPSQSAGMQPIAPTALARQARLPFNREAAIQQWLSWIHGLDLITECLIWLLPVVGLVTVLLPGMRRRLVERRLNLCSLSATNYPAATELAAYIQTQAPRVALMANPLRPGLAFVYPASWRRPRLALLGDLLRLWRTDRPAAMAALQHELSHLRRGDHLIVGYGSFFSVLLQIAVFSPLLITLLTIPCLHFSRNPESTDNGWYLLSQVEDYALPMIATIAADILRIIGLLAVVWLAIWISELGADAQAAGSPAERQALLTLLRSHTSPSWRTRLLALISHPPKHLRRLLLHLPFPRCTMILLMLLFPLAFLAQALALLTGAMLTYMGNHSDHIKSKMLYLVQSFAHGYAWIWVAIALVILIWPICCARWESLLVGSASKLSQRRIPWGIYCLAALFPILIEVALRNLK